MNDDKLKLIVRRTIRASDRQLFEAWTRPKNLMRWWGPTPVKCVGAEIDLRTGGAYRIANQFPVARRKRYCVIEGEVRSGRAAEQRLVYSWRVGGASSFVERVTVQFEARGDSTEVIVVHERIPDAAARDRHELG